MDVGERDARPRRRGRTRGRWPRGARARLVARRRNPRIRWGRWARGARAARPRLRGAVARQRLRRCACVAARTECAPPPRLNGARPQTCVFAEPWRPNSRAVRGRFARDSAGRLSGQGEHRRRALGTSPSLGGLNPAGGIRTHMEFERTCPSISNPTETEVAELVGSTAGMAGPQARWRWRGSPVNARRVSRGYGDAVGEGAPRRNGGHDHVVLRSRGKESLSPALESPQNHELLPKIIVMFYACRAMR